MLHTDGKWHANVVRVVRESTAGSRFSLRNQLATIAYEQVEICFALPLPATDGQGSLQQRLWLTGGFVPVPGQQVLSLMLAMFMTNTACF